MRFSGAATVPGSGPGREDLAALLTSLGIGEAVVTILSEEGAPTPVAWTRLRPPASLMGPLDAAQQEALVAASPLQEEYGVPVDRDSAYERLLAKVAPQPSQEEPPAPAEAPHTQQGQEPSRVGGAVAGLLGSSIFRSFARSAASAPAVRSAGTCSGPHLVAVRRVVAARPGDPS